jgi:KUP system potassium uptake protein
MTRKRQGIAALALGALGVVFGDIGTSPLYAIHVLFGPSGLNFTMNQENIYGIISLILWSVTLVVSVKYLSFIMRVNNKGEGGIMALVGLIKASEMQDKYKGLLILIGLIGVSFFYGDSVITPAISVLSAVEGLKVVAPHVDGIIIPTTLIILTLLFVLQRRGTNVIGQLFGPVMLVWFLTIGAGGAWQIWQHPGVLAALSPVTALDFFVHNPLAGFLAMGAVVLAITGAEALYADMGHFGRRPIARAWFFVVFPALLLCYMGQGALLLHDPATIVNPLVLLFPSELHVSIIILATFATLIASQSVISGAFSLTYQATQLDFLPRMLVKHTSVQETGQIYLPFINLLLFIAVFLLVQLFGSSQALAGAFGIAVSGTLAIDTILFAAVSSLGGRKAWLGVAIALVAFLPVDLLFFTGNIPKILHGGWFPLSLAIMVFIVLTTWMKGQKIVVRQRHEMEGPLAEFIDEVNRKKPPVIRLPGQAVYISQHPDFTPLALRAAIDELDELHEKVVIVSVRVTNEAHVPAKERAIFDPLDNHNDGISHVSLKYGFHDPINIPYTLKAIRGMSRELDFDPDEASYFVSHSKVVLGGRHHMARWRKALYIVMARNSLSSSDFYKLPFNRTVEMRSLISL